MAHQHQSTLDEAELVARCLRGDPAAWEAMFEGYYHPLLSIIKTWTQGAGATPMAEEIASAVWSDLYSKASSRLRRYDPRVGRLLGYLASLARSEIRSRRRSERGRFSRERVAARGEATRDEVDLRLLVQEFLATLTRREREFCLTELITQSHDTASAGLSSANEWQLRSRVLKKFRAYFLQDNIP